MGSGFRRVAAVALVAPAFGFLRGVVSRLASGEGGERWRQTGRLPVRNEARGTDEELA